jgi:hypothetical protein
MPPAPRLCSGCLHYVLCKSNSPSENYMPIMICRNDSLSNEYSPRTVSRDTIRSDTVTQVLVVAPPSRPTSCFKTAAINHLKSEHLLDLMPWKDFDRLSINPTNFFFHKRPCGLDPSHGNPRGEKVPPLSVSSRTTSSLLRSGASIV